VAHLLWRTLVSAAFRLKESLSGHYYSLFKRTFVFSLMIGDLKS
jgi:hypothetical protein